MTLRFEPIDAPLGAEVHGFDFSAPLTSETLNQIREARDEHLLLFFRNGDNVPSDAQVIEFCTNFGTLKLTLADKSRRRDHPHINLVSNQVVDGVEGTGGTGYLGWHGDLHFTPPVLETIYLDALVIPANGGNTMWANMCAAYDALDPKMAERIEDMSVRYRLKPEISDYFKAADLNVDLVTEIGLVQTNPTTGRKAVWPNTGDEIQAQIVGLSPEASAELMAELYAHCTQDRFTYAHEWKVGDAFLWRNNQTMHARQAFSADEQRVMRHVNVLGTPDRFQLAELRSA